MKYNKLVRNRVPELIQADGRQVIFKHLNQAEKFENARLKLYEELKEYEDANIDEECLEELVDILELAYALGKMHGASFEEMESIRAKKREQKGGFEKGLFLEEVLD